jgi:multidrug efflux pump subunit AcrA (membrane-fusion protein)
MMNALEARAPTWIASAALWTICAAVAAAIAVATYTFTNLVVGGDAVVIPGGKTARVQSKEDGRVAKILVKEGASVRRGAPIVQLYKPELDTKIKELALRIGAQRRMLAAQQKLAALHARDRDLASARYATDTQSTRQALDAAMGDTKGSESEAERRKARLTNLTELLNAGAIAETQFEDEVYEQLQAAERARRSRLQAETLEIELSKIHQTREHAQLEADRLELSNRIGVEQTLDSLAALERELAIAEAERAEATLVAPCDGFVEDLGVSHVGEVVARGETIAMLVPRQDEFLAEVRVPSRGIGLVHPGQSVRLKLDSYPYREYGSATGEVVRIPTDTTHDEAKRERLGQYVVLVRLKGRPNDGAGQPVALRAGMTGAAEMIVRRERLIQVLLRPWSGGWDAVPVR